MYSTVQKYCTDQPRFERERRAVKRTRPNPWHVLLNASDRAVRRIIARHTLDGDGDVLAGNALLPLDQLESMAGKYPDLLRAFVRALSLEITRDQSLSTWLGRLDAEQRVARFLLRLCERYQKLGYAKDALLLHMSRDDIGSYLALSTETVSRVISRLSRRGLPTVEQRHIGVPDFSRLTQAAAW